MCGSVGSNQQGSQLNYTHHIFQYFQLIEIILQAIPVTLSNHLLNLYLYFNEPHTHQTPHIVILVQKCTADLGI